MQNVVWRVLACVEPRTLEVVPFACLQELISVLVAAVVNPVDLRGEQVVYLLGDLIACPIGVDRQDDLVEGV